MTITASLGSGLTTVTNPNPNTLTTKTPFPNPFVDGMTVSTAWTSQGSKALFPVPADGLVGPSAVNLHFIPSTPGATYTITSYQYDRISGTWGTPSSGGTNTYTGDETANLVNPGIDPWFFQIVSISAGTLTLNFNGQVAQAQ